MMSIESAIKIRFDYAVSTLDAQQSGPSQSMLEFEMRVTKMRVRSK
jgi:hypothetical protein